jgi:hypothetical protein
LGLTKPQRVELPKVFAVSWKDFERWSVSYNQRAVTSIDISRGRYPLRRLGECLVAMQYGTSEKANQRGAGVPILRRFFRTHSRTCAAFSGTPLIMVSH